MAKKDKTSVTATVYRREYIGQNEVYKSWSYIGETIDIDTRNAKFHDPNNHNYAGAKIENARTVLGVDKKDWNTTILYQKTFSCTPPDTYEEVKKQAKAHIKPIQTQKIIEFDSIEHGFNTSLSDGLDGVTLDDETKKKIGAASKGRKHSPETRTKISEANKGRKVDDATKAKISAGNSGKKRTAEQNAAQSKRLKGKEPKAASLGAAKWREANPGGYWSNHPISEKTKAKAKATQQSRFPDIIAYDKEGNMMGVFKSMNEIKEKLKDAPGTIHNNLRHTDKNHFSQNGYRYEYNK